MSKQEFMLVRKIGGRAVDAFYTDQVKAAYARIPKGGSVEVVYVRAESRAHALELAQDARGWKVVTRNRDGVAFANPVNKVELLLGGLGPDDMSQLMDDIESIESTKARQRSRAINLLASLVDDLNGAGVDFVDDDIIFVDINSADKPTLMFLRKEGRFVVGSLREGINKVMEE